MLEQKKTATLQLLTDLNILFRLYIIIIKLGSRGLGIQIMKYKSRRMTSFCLYNSYYKAAQVHSFFLGAYISEFLEMNSAIKYPQKITTSQELQLKY
ncbi:hypothetical protein DsansV1_C19g0160521 [Dioscorea sansibarensis]